MTRAQRLFWNVLGVVLFLLAWEAAGRWLGSRVLAAPSLVAREYVDLLRAGTMLSELASSLRQMLVGFGLACAVGMPLGIVMGRVKLVERIMTPWIGMMVVTSVAAMVPLFLLVLGTGFSFRVAIVFVAALWYIVITAYNGARGVDPGLLAVARSFGATPAQTAVKVVFPAVYPYLIAGARIGLVHAIRAMVMAEMFVILGYGGLIHQTGMMADTEPLIGLLVTLMAVSVLATWLLRVVGHKVAPSYEQRIAGA
ncbi:MAG TPA: ABC transporter permease subunit [Usitatibacter sp.]|nr:ABC transporter permease subunit [Usitatibacter sp.]